MNYPSILPLAPIILFFFLNDPATTEIHPLPLHDPLPICFEMGADDYVTKPFSPRELIARIRAVARRGRPGDVEKKPHVKIGDLEIDRYRFEIRMQGRDRKSTRLNSSHLVISYAVFCLKKK